MQDGDEPSADVGAAIDHGVKAGACWAAARSQHPRRDLWRYIGEAHSRHATERLRCFVYRAQGPKTADSLRAISPTIASAVYRHGTEDPSLDLDTYLADVLTELDRRGIGQRRHGEATDLKVAGTVSGDGAITLKSESEARIAAMASA